MRSHRESSSPSSADTTSTARPWSRLSTMRWWMNSIAPRSMPRVGWAARRRSPAFVNSRATMTFCWSQPGQRLDELVLPVALDARHAHDLSAPHRQGEAAHGGQAAVVLDLEVRDLEHGRAGTRGPLRHLEEHGPADHELRQLGDGRLRCHALAHHATTAHDGDAIGDVEYLAQLVRDEDDGRAL